MTEIKTFSRIPLLTIAIPTWNRQEYLRQNLRQLKAEIDTVGHHLVEVLVSDNCSTDATPDVVREAQEDGLPVRYVRNAENLGWALNFAQCVDLANGKYLLLFGDDDVLCNGTLSLLLEQLAAGDYGVICLRPYGYDKDYRLENPGGEGRIRRFDDAGRFLVSISQYFTLTSALVINRTMLSNVDSRQFIHTNLATFHLVLRAALAAKSNLYIEKFLVASKRQNSFSYEYYKVFVNEFWSIIDQHVQYGLSKEALRSLETWRLLTYYPFYMLDLRTSGRGDLEGTDLALNARFHDRLLFKYWVRPILRLPRPLAIMWGTLAMTLGRLARGDLRRGMSFIRDRLRRLLQRS
ncbi:glycosyl transferase [Ferrigenium kumadai]|uniref:Glycosyl transferase n=1 Tax=Ferrigenium kumadai TaxID=1682490 RepID=A0AAN1T2C9_9PROT|nr:glycosyltransferase family 2 protein [Ferrigenium kumadai]BBJ00650.1 glycosyl transferase [Ferrigenium kumadai]